MRLIQALETAATRTAGALWPLVRRVADRNRQAPFQPDWAPAPLQGPGQHMPTLHWPRETDSLCPHCVKEAREAIVSGARDWQALLDETPGEVRAVIREQGGQEGERPCLREIKERETEDREVGGRGCAREPELFQDSG